MKEFAAIRGIEDAARHEDSQTTESQRSGGLSPAIVDMIPTSPNGEDAPQELGDQDGDGLVLLGVADWDGELEIPCSQADQERDAEAAENRKRADERHQSEDEDRLPGSGSSLRCCPQRREAYRTMLLNAKGEAWSSIDLLSAGNSHDVQEAEL